MNNTLYVNDYQINEIICGTIVFVILFVMYNIFYGILSIPNIIYNGVAFLIMMYVANLGYNFSGKYL